MFRIVDAKGYQMRFTNGYTVSVQWGPGNYCDRRNEAYDTQYTEPMWTSNTAEVAVIAPDGTFLKFFSDDEVRGYVQADDVVAIMLQVQKM
jgi:hypothetical protein